MTPGVRALRFWLVGLAGLAVQLGVLVALNRGAGVPIAVATALAVAAAVAHNFAWHRRWTWEDRSHAHGWAAFGRFVAANGVISLVGNVVLTTAAATLWDVPVAIANVSAVVLSGVANFLVSDRMVFRARRERCYH